MTALRRENLVVGLDIGTTKICALVAKAHEGKLEILGYGISPSKGLRKGVIVNVESTIRSIKKAIESAESMANCKINSVYVGIAGSHIRGFDGQGVIGLKNSEVSKEDVARVLSQAQSVALPIDREIIHVLPQEFLIDDQIRTKDPLGMSGDRLLARVHIVTGTITSSQNIVRCAHKADLKVDGIILEQIASANAVLTEDERELGVVLVDIGGGTTDIAIFLRGSIVRTQVIPIGGQHLTNDISVGLRTPHESAETIKTTYGTTRFDHVGSDEVIEVPSIGDRAPRILRRQILTDILVPRVEEIFELVAREIEETGAKDQIASGIVLTGGSALLPGVTQAAEEMLGLPVRLGVPRHTGGYSELCHPSYSAALGLVLYGVKEIELKLEKQQQNTFYNKVRHKMGTWIQEMI